VSHLRAGSVQAHRSPSVYHQQPFVQQSPSSQSHSSPATSTPTSASHAHSQLLLETHSSTPSQQVHSGVGNPSHPMASVMNSNAPRYPQQQQQQNSSFQQSSPAATPGHRSTPGEMYPQQAGPSHAPYSQPGQPGQNYAVGHSVPVLPPFSSLETTGSSRAQVNNVSSVRYHSVDTSNQTRHQHFRPGESSSGLKRAVSASNAPSAESSDIEEEDNGELPASGLVAPWEVLRGLADVAVQRASKVPNPLYQLSILLTPITGER
jgi:hypothetical protein